MKVLIADDEVVAQKKLSFLIKKLGHQILPAKNGAEAFDLWCQHKPRILITDWAMPVLDGLELCKKIRAVEHDDYTFIVLVTAQDAKDSIQEGLTVGIDAYIIKPFTKNELIFQIKTGERIIELHQEQAKRKKLEAVFEMAGAICHEINQPLQAISGYAEIALNRISVTDPIHKHLAEIGNQVDRMGEITRKLMNITEYETKPYIANSKIVDIDKSSQ